jgi:hypothetical protein
MISFRNTSLSKKNVCLFFHVNYWFVLVVFSPTKSMFVYFYEYVIFINKFLLTSSLLLDGNSKEFDN